MRPPYSEWGAEQRAAEAGMRLVDNLAFDQARFPGYRRAPAPAAPDARAAH